MPTIGTVLKLHFLLANIKITIKRFQAPFPWAKMRQECYLYFTWIPDTVVNTSTQPVFPWRSRIGPDINFLPLSSPLVPVSHYWTTHNWSIFGIHLFPSPPVKSYLRNDQLVQLKWEESNHQLHRGPQAGLTIHRVCQVLCHAVNLLCGVCSNVRLQNQDLFGWNQ